MKSALSRNRALIFAVCIALTGCDQTIGPAQAQVASAASISVDDIPVFEDADLTADETVRRFVSTATPEAVFVFYREHFETQDGVVVSTQPYDLAREHHAMLESKRPTKVEGQWIETAGFQWSRTRPDGKTVEFNLIIQDDGLAEDRSAYEARTVIDVTSVLRP